MEEFNKLLKKYLQGETTPEEEKQLEGWYQNQPDITFPEMSDQSKKVLERKVWRGIRSELFGRTPTWPKIGLWMGVAACLLAGVLWYYPLVKPRETTSPMASQQKRFEIRNTTGSDQEIMLADSTIVILKENSRLDYHWRFNQDKREVFLQGEAFFQVKRDEMRPFVVHAGNLVTEVLGTSFLIKEADHTTEVSVTSGKVSVYADNAPGKDKKNGVILTANQQVSFRRDTQQITAGIVEEPVPKPDNEIVLPSLDFRSVPLQEVLDALTQHYGIEFVIANPRVKDCGISADLTGLSMFTQVELICKSIDASYERRGTVVFINGDGC